ncbi:transmembrane protein, putative [Medicago truncatula]|uniref:Transmembrane protein, putative n=1 Tax=Medicago truncatula TaxID=3880 RepID=A0A072U6X2_MEDTR|nr:transmembrane protein, putative [Medicago truncatula]
MGGGLMGLSRGEPRWASIWWKGLIKLGDFGELNWFNSGLERQVGNGLNSSFWGDIWRGDSSFRSRYLRLYSISDQKEAKDKWRWKLDESGIFTVSSAYKRLEGIVLSEVGWSRGWRRKEFSRGCGRVRRLQSVGLEMDEELNEYTGLFIFRVVLEPSMVPKSATYPVVMVWRLGVLVFRQLCPAGAAAACLIRWSILSVAGLFLGFLEIFTIINKITTAQYFLSMRLHKDAQAHTQETSNAQALSKRLLMLKHKSKRLLIKQKYFPSDENLASDDPLLLMTSSLQKHSELQERFSSDA